MQMAVNSPDFYLQNSALLYSEQQISAAIDHLALEIAQNYQHQPSAQPFTMLCLMTGGMYLAGKLLSKLNIPLQVDYCHLSRYANQLSGGDSHWYRFPTDIQGKHILVVDDILDEGITLRSVIDACVAAGAASVKTVVLVDKQNGLSKNVKCDFVGLEVPNQYVFGCGMDVHGWWRNLNEIRVYIGE